VRQVERPRLQQPRRNLRGFWCMRLTGRPLCLLLRPLRLPRLVRRQRVALAAVVVEAARVVAVEEREAVEARLVLRRCHFRWSVRKGPVRP
jgi:hypothetical protein